MLTISICFSSGLAEVARPEEKLLLPPLIISVQIVGRVIWYMYQAIALIE